MLQCCGNASSFSVVLSVAGVKSLLLLGSLCCSVVKMNCHVVDVCCVAAIWCGL